MPDQLLNLLKLFLLLLLYLFFFRVVRAVWAEMAPLGHPEQAPAPAQRKGRQRTQRRTRTGRTSEPSLTALAPPELKGRAFPLSDELTVGRAAGCQVTLEDSYASQLHARVFARDGQFYVEDLGSTNGTYLNRRKVTAPMVIQRGDKLQIGNTVLEMR